MNYKLLVTPFFDRFQDTHFYMVVISYKGRSSKIARQVIAETMSITKAALIFDRAKAQDYIADVSPGFIITSVYLSLYRVEENGEATLKREQELSIQAK